MNNIIEDLFNKYDEERRPTKEVLKFEELISKCEDKLMADLSEEEKKLFNQITDLRCDKSCEEIKDSFIAGFKMGNQIGYETMRD